MSEKNLVLILVAHQGYIRCTDSQKDFGAENDILFSAISQTYLPLINLFHKLKKEKVPFKISLVLSPALCALLDDSVIKKQYVEWLDRRIALGEHEIERLKEKPKLQKNAQFCLTQAQQNKIDFVEKYRQNLLAQFSMFAKKGYIELLATTGTYAFLPHYADMPEVLNAQIETGSYSHKYFFDSAAEGLWLPFMGYAPGIETVIRSYGLNYTILDTQALLFSETQPADGIFSPVRAANSLAIFARDRDTPDDITNIQTGFAANKVYKNQQKDIAFELPPEELSDFLKTDFARVNSLYRYWSKIEDESGVCEPYDYEKACVQAQKDAQSFLEQKNKKLDEAASLLNKKVCLVCVLDASILGQDWAEGIIWLEDVLRENSGSRFASCGELIENQFKFQKIVPYPSAASGTGYGEDLLDNTNSSMIRYTRKMCDRMVDLSDRFPLDTGLKIRLLNLAARELLLAQSSEWPKMLHDGKLPEYVEKRFKEFVIAFTTVFDSLGSNTVSTEWLTRLEKEHAIFPWMNYRIFSKKK